MLFWLMRTFGEPRGPPKFSYDRLPDRCLATIGCYGNAGDAGREHGVWYLVLQPAVTIGNKADIYYINCGLFGNIRQDNVIVSRSRIVLLNEQRDRRELAVSDRIGVNIDHDCACHELRWLARSQSQRHYG